MFYRIYRVLAVGFEVLEFWGFGFSGPGMPRWRGALGLQGLDRDHLFFCFCFASWAAENLAPAHIFDPESVLGF